MSHTVPVDAADRVALVVLAGGSSRRWGGVDKTARPLGDRSLLAHVVLSAGADLTPIVVVAPADHPARDILAEGGRPVLWTREDPPGGGPVAGLAAGLAALDDSPAAIVVVLAADMPFAGPAVPRLLAALDRTPDADGALGLDPAGVQQPLLAGYRRAALQRAVGGPAAPDPNGRSLRDVLRGLRLVEIALTAREALDLDTPERFARALTELHRPPGGPGRT